MSTPSPYLTYHFWHGVDIHPSPAGLVIIDGPALFDVHEASASIYRGALRVIVTGRMRKRDGEPGPRRSAVIDLTQEQPEWMDDLITDARRRLYDV